MKTHDAQKPSENYLADWAAQKISNKKLEKWEAPASIALYEKILDTTDQWEAPRSNALAWETFSKKLPPKEVSKKVSVRRWLAVAASFLALVGISSYFLAFKTITTENRFREVRLADGSTGLLSPHSQIRYNSLTWAFNRKVSLEGDATFTVEKGTPFSVKTAQGKVTVLGTVFRVIDEGNFFDVSCFEGKVRVTTDGKSLVLTPGKNYNSNTQKVRETSLTPVYENANYIPYDRVPLTMVFQKLEKIYGISFQVSLDQTFFFTGKIPVYDLDAALLSITTPFPIEPIKTNPTTFEVKPKMLHED